jgi:hypothetical protein
MSGKPKSWKAYAGEILSLAIVIIFIEPLLKHLGEGLLWLGTNVSESLVNYLYQDAAAGFRELFSFYAFSFAVFAGIIFILSRLFQAFEMVGRTRRRAQRLIALTQAPTPTPVQISEVRAQINELKASFRTTDKLLYVLVATTGVLLFVAIYMLTSSYVVLQLNTSFNQELAVLGAKASDQQIKELRSEWAQMRTRKDYEVLSSRIEALAAEQGVKLPPILWQ